MPMPPGAGRVQTALIRLLRQEPAGLSPLDLTCLVYDTKAPSEAQRGSVWRALRTLNRQGRIARRHAVFEVI